MEALFGDVELIDGSGCSFPPSALSANKVVGLYFRFCYGAPVVPAATLLFLFVDLLQPQWF